MMFSGSPEGDLFDVQEPPPPPEFWYHSSSGLSNTTSHQFGITNEPQSCEAPPPALPCDRLVVLLWSAAPEPAMLLALSLGCRRG
jgi:hypothetical protein